VRAYELDTRGNVTTAAYLQYADHARWKVLEAAGVDVRAQAPAGRSTSSVSAVSSGAVTASSTAPATDSGRR
jgi:acyl-CoA thioesterase FadM